MPGAPASCKLADHLLEGRLSALVASWRADGMSWEQIAREVSRRTERVVDVTGQTISKNWSPHLLPPDQAA